MFWVMLTYMLLLMWIFTADIETMRRHDNNGRLIPPNQQLLYVILKTNIHTLKSWSLIC